MNFREKIDKVLEIKGIKLYKLCEVSKLGSTLQKAYEDNREMKTPSTEKFLENLRINRKWWESGEGQIFSEDEKTTSVDSDTKTEDEIKILEFYQNLFEAKTEYIVIPKKMVQEDYRVVLKSEMDSKERLLYEVIEAKNGLIEALKNEIVDLRGKTEMSSVQSKKA